MYEQSGEFVLWLSPEEESHWHVSNDGILQDDLQREYDLPYTGREIHLKMCQTRRRITEARPPQSIGALFY